MARELTTLIEQRGKPGMIVSDNGTEFTSNAMLVWTEAHPRKNHWLDLGRPKPQDLPPPVDSAQRTRAFPMIDWQNDGAS